MSYKRSDYNICPLQFNDALCAYVVRFPCGKGIVHVFAEISKWRILRAERWRLTSSGWAIFFFFLVLLSETCCVVIYMASEIQYRCHLSRYGDFHYKATTVVRLSNLCKGISMSFQMHLYIKTCIILARNPIFNMDYLEQHCFHHYFATQIIRYIKDGAYEIFAMYIFSSVCLRLSPFSQIYLKQYMETLGFHFTHLPVDVCKNICISLLFVFVDVYISFLFSCVE